MPIKTTDVEKITRKVCNTLDKIIDRNMAHYKIEHRNNPDKVSFIVNDSCYGYNKFILDKIEGHYEYSLWSLIHYILYQDKHYQRILTEQQLLQCECLIREDIFAIYNPVHADGKDDSETLDKIDAIMFDCVLYVGHRLKNAGFQVDAYLEKMLIDV